MSSQAVHTASNKQEAAKQCTWPTIWSAATRSTGSASGSALITAAAERRVVELKLSCTLRALLYPVQQTHPACWPFNQSGLGRSSALPWWQLPFWPRLHEQPSRANHLPATCTLPRSQRCVTTLTVCCAVHARICWFSPNSTLLHAA